MPRGDGTGPMGAGPMTGRAAGICAGYGAPGFMNAPFGRGGGRGWGRRGGYGLGRGAWGVPAFAPVPVPPVQQADMLRQHAQALKSQLEAIEKQIADMGGEE